MDRRGFFEPNGQDSTYERWKDLVNMSAKELKAFKNSKWGRQAGLSKADAKRQGIKSGRTSAEWILRMRATRPSKWTPEMWEWAQRQISFNSRMRGMSGPMYERRVRAGARTFVGSVDGEKMLLEPTRKLLSLLIWGHDPERYEMGKRSLLLDEVLS